MLFSVDGEFQIDVVCKPVSSVDRIDIFAINVTSTMTVKEACDAVVTVKSCLQKLTGTAEPTTQKLLDAWLRPENADWPEKMGCAVKELALKYH